METVTPGSCRAEFDVECRAVVRPDGPQAVVVVITTHVDGRSDLDTSVSYRVDMSGMTLEERLAAWRVLEQCMHTARPAATAR